ncbi:Transcription initiation factor IIE subunit beta [Blastocladiella emersonii ATCC 22665]|nr:Transcription initiation factor IIE subunit beta [Blastocladiella emersonii ATCC 22665]
MMSKQQAESEKLMLRVVMYANTIESMLAKDPGERYPYFHFRDKLDIDLSLDTKEAVAVLNVLKKRKTVVVDEKRRELWHRTKYVYATADELLALLRRKHGGEDLGDIDEALDQRDQERQRAMRYLRYEDVKKSNKHHATRLIAELVDRQLAFVVYKEQDTALAATATEAQREKLAVSIHYNPYPPSAETPFAMEKEFRDEFTKLDPPDDATLHKELQAKGLKEHAFLKKPVKSGVGKKAKAHKARPQKLTNVHLENTELDTSKTLLDK